MAADDDYRNQRPSNTHYRVPLKNAPNNAFDKSDSARVVGHDFIAKITAEVKQSVLDDIEKNRVGLGSIQSQPPPQQAYTPQSSTFASASFPLRRFHPPPSSEYSRRDSAYPNSLANDPIFDGASDAPTPRHERSAAVNIPREMRSQSRRASTQRMSTDGDFAPFEKIWQRLFDEEGRPTPRLGQLLRGLALHLIKDYEPKDSLVVSTSKMLSFYNNVEVHKETYLWQKIFSGLPNATIKKIYRDMGCQHHLIQERLTDQPDIPALTPQGFEAWMTVMIQAYPDTEYERLSKAVLNMPISNGDDCKERFPKILPRRLFPQRGSLPAQQRCAAALSAKGVGPLCNAPTFPGPPPIRRPKHVRNSLSDSY